MATSKRAQQLLEMPQQQLEHGKVSPKQVIPSSGKAKIEALYDENNLEAGDRMRLISSDGDLIDVVANPDGSVSVQVVTLHVKYGATTTYASWEDVDKVADKFNFYQAIASKRKVENPYE